MASLTEVFAIESDRATSDKWNKIHLFKMGDFWRAYEWSAWLIAVITFNDEVRMATKDRRPLQVTRMNRTDVEGTYCFVGFPVRSLEKYIPTRENFESIDDKHVVVTITLPQPADGSELNEELFATAINQWREGIELKKKKDKADKAADDTTGAMAGNQHPTGGGILSQIMAYPISERTAIENIQFIQSLKQQLATIL
jgi:hypothetical protein